MRGGRSFGREDSGQLMLLAGIIVTSAFILTALTLSQVSTIERQSATDKPSTLSSEWRFLHERLATNFATAASPELTNGTFKDSTLQAVVATFRNIEAEKGYDMVIRLAAPTFDTTEADLVDASSPPRYAATSADGEVPFAFHYDGTDDGILWQYPCPDTTATGGCIAGVYVYVRISDGASSMEETMLFAVNQG